MASGHLNILKIFVVKLTSGWGKLGELKLLWSANSPLVQGLCKLTTPGGLQFILINYVGYSVTDTTVN